MEVVYDKQAALVFLTGIRVDPSDIYPHCLGDGPTMPDYRPSGNL
jgi:hypothetical protein